MGKKVNTFASLDLKYASTSLDDYVGKSITIVSVTEKGGEYKDFFIATLSDGKEVVIGGVAVVKILQAVQEKKGFPIKVVVEKVKSKKNPKYSYFVFQ